MADRTPSAPAGWLFANAHVLHQTRHIPATHDLEPLLDLVGDATVVGLGDGTHVREKNFDVIALEAAFPVMNRVNTYVQGGPGDPRAILRDAATRLAYGGGSDGNAMAIPLELPLHHDAVVYVDRTTPVTSIMP